MSVDAWLPFKCIQMVKGVKEIAGRPPPSLLNPDIQVCIYIPSLLQKHSFCSHTSSLDGAMELKCAPFCSS